MMEFRLKYFFSRVNVLSIFVSLSALIFFACGDDGLDGEAFSIGSDLVETHTQLGFIDTLSVELSTVILDSVQTSGTGRMLVGQYTDGEFGSVNATSFFQVGIASSVLDEKKSVYDSLVLVLGYDDYYYGDTLQKQTLQVYPLAEETDENDDGYFYNTSKIYASDELIGSKTFKPRMSKETLEIRLSDSLGLELFDLLLERDITTTSGFLDEFPGLALKTITEDGAIMGYAIGDTSSYMVIHYHNKSSSNNEYTAIFNPTNSDLQFNHIETDRTGTVLESWTQQQDDISADITNNRVYVQGATGVLTRVEFPSLVHFNELREELSLLKAELTFIPIKGTYEEVTDIPTNTVLYKTGKKSVMHNPVLNANRDAIQYGSTNVDLQYHKNTYISFDITVDIKTYFNDEIFEPEKEAFLLGLSDPEYYSTFDNTILGGLNDPNYTPKLLIYYIRYQK